MINTVVSVGLAL